MGNVSETCPRISPVRTLCGVAGPLPLEPDRLRFGTVDLTPSRGVNGSQCSPACVG